MTPELLLTGAQLFPLGIVPPDADAVLIRNGLIEALGRVAELATALEPGSQTIDLRGKTALPGFCDTHVHLVETGLLCHGVDLSPAGTIDQVLEILSAEFARRPDPGFLRGHSLDPSLLREKRYPRIDELDAISSRVPIFVLRRDGHSCVVNTAFYRRCGLSQDVPGVEIEFRREGPTGTLRAQALEMARECRNRLLGDEGRAEAVRRACRQAVEKGVTAVHAICSRPSDVDLFEDLSTELPVDIQPYLTTMNVDLVLQRGLGRIGGDLLIDGSLGSHTAALREPYADRPGERGVLYYRREQLDSFVTRAHRAGLQVAMHAIGDRAIDQVLAAYEAALDRHPRGDHRHRLEHAELLSDDHIRRIAEREIVLAVQPAFEAFWGGSGGMYASRLGDRRVLRTNPFRALVDSGVVIAGGSDSYITPIDPLAGIAAAVNHPNPEHRLTALEAVRMFTADAAYVGFQECERGLLQVGMKADLVILTDDPRSVPREEIADIGVEMVFKDGRVVFGSKCKTEANMGTKK